MVECNSIKLIVTEAFVNFTINSKIPLHVCYDRQNDYFILKRNDCYDFITRDFYEVDNEINSFMRENNISENVPTSSEIRSEFNLNLNEFKYLTSLHIIKNCGFSFKTFDNLYVEVFDRGFKYDCNITKYSNDGEVFFNDSKMCYKEKDNNKNNLLKLFKTGIPNFRRYEKELNIILNRMRYKVFGEVN